MRKVKTVKLKEELAVKTGEEITIKLPGETVVVGPGTVPTSTASVSQTSIKDVIAGAKRASKLGLFDFPTPGTVNE